MFHVFIYFFVSQKKIRSLHNTVSKNPSVSLTLYGQENQSELLKGVDQTTFFSGFVY